MKNGHLHFVLGALIFVFGCNDGGEKTPGVSSKLPVPQEAPAPQPAPNIPAPSPAPEIPVPPSTAIEHLTSEILIGHLEFALIDNFEVAEALSDSEKVIVEKFVREMSICGLNFVGPKCLDYSTSYFRDGRNYEVGLELVDEKGIFYARVKPRNFNSPVLFAFSFEFNRSLKIKSVRAFEELNEFKPKIFPEDFDNPAATKLLFSATLVEDAYAESLKRIQNPREMRELYHLSHEILRAWRTYTSDYYGVLKKVSEAYVESFDSLFPSASEEYQKKVVDLIYDTLAISRGKMLDISETLLKNPAAHSQQRAAVYLLNDDPARNELKEIVLQAFKHPYWTVRKSAVEALAKSTNLTSTEENSILAMMNDPVDNVRNAAERVGSQLLLDDSNFKTLTELSESANYWTTRKSVLSFISKIPGESATEAIVRRMSDVVDDVRAQAVGLMNQRPLSIANLAVLNSQLDSIYWTTRIETAKLIAKIPDESATLLLINRMSDRVDDVRIKLVELLSKREITAENIEPLSLQLKSDLWTVRRDAAMLLAKSPRRITTEILIGGMSDQVDDVRNTIFEILNQRNLDRDDVRFLAEQFQSPIWTARRSVAVLLGKIKDQTSLNALVDQLKVERVNEVRSEITRSIEKVK